MFTCVHEWPVQGDWTELGIKFMKAPPVQSRYIGVGRLDKVICWNWFSKFLCRTRDHMARERHDSGAGNINDGFDQEK